MKHVVVCFHLTVFVALLCASGTVTAGIVKQSTSGLCHPPESGWYDRTQNYTPFETVSVRQTDSEYRPGYTAGDIAQFAGKTQMAALLAT